MGERRLPTEPSRLHSSRLAINFPTIGSLVARIRVSDQARRECEYLVDEGIETCALCWAPARHASDENGTLKSVLDSFMPSFFPGFWYLSRLDIQ